MEIFMLRILNESKPCEPCHPNPGKGGHKPKR